MPPPTSMDRNAVVLSIIVPVLDEAEGIGATLLALAPLRDRGAEVIVVDGGSHDATVDVARVRCDRILLSAPGRARQMNAGAACAQGDVLLFLHADTRLPPGADVPVLAAVREGANWGRFDAHIEGRHPMLRVIAAMMNWRSRLTGIATGDQAMFVRRDAFEGIGGFPDQPLMEDVELSVRLRRAGAPACLQDRVATSGRRWEARGVWRTILLMWRLRWRYWRGDSPERLAATYK